MKYIHLNTILKYIKAVEGIEFKIVNSEDYDITGITSFKVIIPKSFNVNKVELVEGLDDCALYTVNVYNDKNENALDGSYILLWNSELYSTEEEASVCLSEEAIENGILIFENFKNIPFIVDSKEILRTV